MFDQGGHAVELAILIHAHGEGMRGFQAGFAHDFPGKALPQIGLIEIGRIDVDFGDAWQLQVETEIVPIIEIEFKTLFRLG